MLFNCGTSLNCVFSAIMQVVNYDAPKYSYTETGLLVYYWRDIISLGICTTILMQCALLMVLTGCLSPQLIHPSLISAKDFNRYEQMQRMRERRRVMELKGLLGPRESDGPLGRAGTSGKGNSQRKRGRNVIGAVAVDDVGAGASLAGATVAAAVSETGVDGEEGGSAEPDISKGAPEQRVGFFGTALDPAGGRKNADLEAATYGDGDRDGGGGGGGDGGGDDGGTTHPVLDTAMGAGGEAMEEDGTKHTARSGGSRGSRGSRYSSMGVELFPAH